MGATVPGEPAVEDHFNPDHPNPRVASELAGYEQLQRGINVSVMRLSQINTRKQGLVTSLIEIAEKAGLSAYIGDGTNRWSAAHVDDTAHLYRLAVERAEPGACYHAAAEQGIAFREIAEAVGGALNVPTASLTEQQAANHFGWLTAFVGKDMSASNVLTRERVGWNPFGPGLLEDLAQLQR